MGALPTVYWSGQEMFGCRACKAEQVDANSPFDLTGGPVWLANHHLRATYPASPLLSAWILSREPHGRLGVRLLDRTEGEMRVTDRKEPIETLRLWEPSVLDDDMAAQSF